MIARRCVDFMTRAVEPAGQRPAGAGM